MSRFAFSSVCALAACGPHQPPDSVPASAQNEAPIPNESGLIVDTAEPARAPDVEVAPLDLELAPAPMGDLPGAWTAHTWQQAITSPKDQQRLDPSVVDTVVVSLLLPKAQSGTTVWLQLDDFQPVAARSGLQLSDLKFEWDELSRGAHRLVLFATDADGRALTGEGGPLLDVVQFAVASGHRATAEAAPAQALLSPHGTLNGQSAASAARLQFWTESETPVVVSIVGPGERRMERRLTRGAYALPELPSGDYHFQLGTDPEMHTTITVNQELSASSMP